ncbi:hypothetical protein KGY73_10470 [bacterium]|nr:hypothetical protein [bacterium]
MKKVKLVVLLVFSFSVIFPSILDADVNDDFQSIKKAVKKNPQYQSGKEVKWFKVLVTDNRTNETKVKVTLPISVVEFFMECADEEDLRIDREEGEMDLKELFKQLKKLGPMNLIEIYEEDETVKVWLE